MADLIVRLLQIASILFIVRAVLSWIRIGPDSPFAPVASFVFNVTEPFLAPVRRVLPTMGGFDFSILVPILVINYLLVPLVRSTLG